MTKVVFINGGVIQIRDFSNKAEISLNETLKLRKEGYKVGFIKGYDKPNEEFILETIFLYKEENEKEIYNMSDWDNALLFDFERIALRLKKWYNIELEKANNAELENDNMEIVETKKNNHKKVIKVYTKKHNITFPKDRYAKLMVNDSNRIILWIFLDYFTNGGDDNGQPNKVESDTD